MEAVKPQTENSVFVATKEEISSQAYHEERGHISSSQLIHVLRTPAHFLYHSLQGSAEESDLMRMGTAVHCMVLEPNEFKNRYVFAPRHYDRRKKVDLAELEAIAAQYPGRTILEPSERFTLEKIVTGLRNHAKARQLLAAPGQSELSIFWRDDLTGIDLKVRIDRLVEVGSTGMMLEVKSTDNASPEAFSRKIIDMDYDLRAVMYADGVQKAYGFTPSIAWLVMERETGFVAMYQPTAKMLQRARRRYEEARIALAHAKSLNSWPAYQTGESIESIDLPRWVKN
ncbi:PD-(D/E)XK nuclease-like domain-containing protein [Curvibacter sp. APW13]|uniref:PD-(D/E)XK nuclease-like domain-containing protein n=1 Tax=Curvibacter sp. APW13 TaxID=3077236 RepID=UPI0028DDDF12|nr:PD-(D/E)XK nuclease-like domain-containing protein [Curvibacter sp. APW13]MDT8992844.1 PD-(D/E)XK nuclease-like domain-containing protein [Curvibacter sp. APW13]